MTVEIDDAQRQLILLALAHLSIERPGFDLNTIALLFDNSLDGRAQLYDEFRRLALEMRGEKALG
jgi:hypothetical protein